MRNQTLGLSLRSSPIFLLLLSVCSYPMGYECTLNSNRKMGYEHMLNSNRKIGYERTLNSFRKMGYERTLTVIGI